MSKKKQNKIEIYLEKKPLAVAIWSFFITAFCFLVIGAVILIPKSGEFKGYFNSTQSSLSSLGDTFNGILGPFIAFLVALLTFLAFYIQYLANEQQKKALRKQKKRDDIERLETKFFEMIKLHRDNVGELSYTYTKVKLAKFSKDDLKKEQTAISRKVFKIIFSDFKCLIEELNHFFAEVKEEAVYEEVYLTILR